MKIAENNEINHNKWPQSIDSSAKNFESGKYRVQNSWHFKKRSEIPDILTIFSNLLTNFVDLLTGDVHHNGKSTNAGYLRGGHIQTFDVDFSPGEDDGDVIQQSCPVFCQHR